MKIEGNIKSVGAPPSAENRARSSGAAQTATASASDKVELSNLSASLNKAEATIASTPVVDRAKVEEIRQAISEGLFTINAERIADRLISSAKQMLEVPGQS